MNLTCPDCGRVIVIADATGTYGTRLTAICGGPVAAPHSSVQMVEG